MAMKIAEAFVEIQGDKGKYSVTIKRAKMETSGFASSATKSLKKVSIGLAAVAAAATAAAIAIGIKLARAIVNVGKSTISAALKFDKLKRGLTAIVGSAAEAERQLIRLREVAKLPGLSFEQAIQGSINLQAAGLSAELSERALKAFGNALVTVGKGAEDLAGVSLALTQMANKTSGFGQDVRQLQERLPQMQTALRNAFDGKPVEELEITGKELVAALVTEFEKLEAASGGPANEIENLQNAFKNLKVVIGNTMLAATGDTAKSLTSIIDKIAAVIPEWDKYRDQVTKVFLDLIPIIAKATTLMMETMLDIIIALAPLVWEPLVFAAGTAFNKLTTVIAKGVVKMAEEIGSGAGQEMIKKLQENIAKSDAGTQEALNKAFKEPFAKAMEDALAKVPGKMTTFITEMVNLLGAVAAGFDTIEVATEGAADEVKKIKLSFDNFDTSLVSLNLDADKFLKTFKTFSQFRIEQMAKKLAKAFNNAGKQSETLKKLMQEFWDLQRKETEDFVNTFKPAFENMFQDLFTGEIKGLWTQFWTDMRDIAIRKLAEIVATAVFDKVISALSDTESEKTTGQYVKEGLITAGIAGIARLGLAVAGLAEGGIVNRPTLALVGERGPEAIVPLNKNGRMGGIVIQSMPISFPNANLENIDETRLEKVMVRMIPHIQQAINRGELQA